MVCSISGLELFPKLEIGLVRLLDMPETCCPVVSTVRCHFIVAFISSFVYEPGCVMCLHEHMMAVL